MVVQRMAQSSNLKREIFTTLEEAKVLIEQWLREYNQVHPHSALGYRPLAPEAILTKITTKRVVSLLEAGHRERANHFRMKLVKRILEWERGIDYKKPEVTNDN